MSEYVLENVITVQVPKELEKSVVSGLIQDTIMKLKIEAEDKKREESLNQKIKEIAGMNLTELLINLKTANRDRILDIVEHHPLYETDIYVKLVTQYYCKYNDIETKYEDIFTAKVSHVVLGMLINIPVYILEKLLMKQCHKWIDEEFEYYKNNGSVRIDNICEHVDFTFNPYLQQYLIRNHYALLKKYNNLISRNYKDEFARINEMKDTLKNI